MRRFSSCQQTDNKPDIPTKQKDFSSNTIKPIPVGLPVSGKQACGSVPAQNSAVLIGGKFFKLPVVPQPKTLALKLPVAPLPPNAAPLNLPVVQQSSASSSEEQEATNSISDPSGKAEGRTVAPQHRIQLKANGAGGLVISHTLPPNETVAWDKDVRVVKLISQGMFGGLYLLHDQRNGELLVGKVYHSAENPNPGGGSEEQLQDFVREVNYVRVLDHPYIVKYKGVSLDSVIAVLLEYLPKGNLFDVLYQCQVELSAAQRLKLARQLVAAVLYLHSSTPPLIHRDIKTQNLVLDVQMNIKLIDFGKSIRANQYGKARLADNGGSPRYMAPECFSVGGVIDEKVDIWGLGTRRTYND
eukprot:Filipodium_phascolosomae@DN471_c0_g1_i2.p1